MSRNWTETRWWNPDRKEMKHGSERDETRIGKRWKVYGEKGSLPKCADKLRFSQWIFHCSLSDILFAISFQMRLNGKISIFCEIFWFRFQRNIFSCNPLIYTFIIFMLTKLPCSLTHFLSISSLTFFPFPLTHILSISSGVDLFEVKFNVPLPNLYNCYHLSSMSWW